MDEVLTLAHCAGVPLLFASIVIAAEADDEWGNENETTKVQKRVWRARFLEKVASTTINTTATTNKEFEAQSLALENDVPIQLARIVVYCETNEHISDDVIHLIRYERLLFLSKIFALLAGMMNNSIQ